MNRRQKITSLERDKLAYWFAIGKSIREISRLLKRSPSSICEELKRNNVGGMYHSIRAQRCTEARSHRSHKKYLLKTTPLLKAYVLEKLSLGWSPEQIAGRLRREITAGLRSSAEYINHESIYQYIYDEEQKDQRLWELLPRRHRKRRFSHGRRHWSARIPNRLSIRRRPEEINARLAFGHWEGDTIVGDQHKTGIHTEVERVSSLLFAQIVPHIRAKDTYQAQLCIFGAIPKHARRSTTLDNGSENYLHSQLSNALAMQTYFADPYCSWQRGTNENTNGLIRRYFPKRTDFRKVSQQELSVVVQRLNDRPRKVLSYQTPLEVFTLHLSASFYQSTAAP